MNSNTVETTAETKEAIIVSTTVKKAPPSTGLWKTIDHRYIPMVKMSEAELKAAFLFAAKMELKFHNKAIKMTEVMEELQMVAEAKGTKLEYPHEVKMCKEYNGYFKNRKEYEERKKARRATVVKQLLD